MVKLPLKKIYASFIVFGFLLMSATPPEIMTGLISKTSPTSSLQSSRDQRDSLPSSLQGGEQSIDAFNVFPTNRWDSESNGPVIETLDSGEFSIEGLINDSSSDYFYRESSTSADTIAARWRLNATADYLTNETDYTLSFQRDWGVDGWGFTEGVDGWTSGSADVVADTGYLRLNETGVGAAGFDVTSPTISVDTTLWESVRFAIYTNASEGVQYRWKDGGGNALTDWVTLPTSSTEYVVVLSDAANWSDTETSFRLNIKPTDGLFLDADSFVFVDYIRLVGNSQFQGDFEVPLVGFNATTSEGTGNTSLNAYSFNNTHYTIRPTITTDDGDNWRSWNLNADYQDYFQMLGRYGAGGIDFIDDAEPVAGLATNTISNGLFIGVVAAGALDSWRPVGVNDDEIPTIDYSYLTIKMRTNDSTLTVKVRASADDGISDLSPTIQLSDTEWIVLTFNLSSDIDWTGLFRYFFLEFDETDGTLDGDEGIFVDYIRLTNEPFSLDSMDFAKYSEHYGADGWSWENGIIERDETSFSDGTIDYSGDETTDDFVRFNGTGSTFGGQFFMFRTLIQPTQQINADIFNTITIRSYKNNTAPLFLEWWDGSAVVKQWDFSASGWNTFTFTEIGSQWAGLEASIIVWLKTAAGNNSAFAPTDWRIDYIRLTHEDASINEISLFEYETYYRCELDYELRRSELEFLIMDDEQDDLVEEAIGAFSIATFFDEEELIPDIFLTIVGQSTYFYGLRSAGANVTFTLDYYEAGFSEFSWDRTGGTDAGDMSTTYTSPYGLFAESNGGAGQSQAIYQQTVPEFDGCSGVLSSNHEGIGIPNIANTFIKFAIFSVSSLNGTMVEEIELLWSPNSASGFWTVDYAIKGIALFRVNASKINSNSSSLGFNFYTDKQNRQITSQASFVTPEEIKGTAFAVSDLAPTQSNEFVLKITYSAGGPIISLLEYKLLLEDWSLTFRDIFDLIGYLPGVDLAGTISGNSGGFNPFGAFLEMINLLGGIIGKLTTISGVIKLVTSAVNGIGTVITGAIDGIGTAITGAITGLETVLDAAIGAVETAIEAVETAIEALEDAIELVETAIDFVTAAVIAIAGQIIVALTAAIEALITEALLFIDLIVDAVVSFIRDIPIVGTTFGDLIDILGMWIGLFVATIATTMEFIIMILTEWSVILLVMIFLLVILLSVTGSQAPGEFFGKVLGGFSFNILPIQIHGYRVHVPLGILVIPFVFIVSLGII